MVTRAAAAVVAGVFAGAVATGEANAQEATATVKKSTPKVLQVTGASADNLMTNLPATDGTLQQSGGVRVIAGPGSVTMYPLPLKGARCVSIHFDGGPPSTSCQVIIDGSNITLDGNKLTINGQKFSLNKGEYFIGQGLTAADLIARHYEVPPLPVRPPGR